MCHVCCFKSFRTHDHISPSLPNTRIATRNTSGYPSFLWTKLFHTSHRVPNTPPRDSECSNRKKRCSTVQHLLAPECQKLKPTLKSQPPLDDKSALHTPGCHVPKQQLSTGRKGEVVRRRGPGSSHENGPPCGGGGGGGSGEVVVEAQFRWWWRWWWWQGCGVYDVRFVHLLSSISHSLFVSACESDSCLWRCC